MNEFAPTALARSLGPGEVTFLTLSAISPAVSVFIFGNGILHLAGTGAAAAVIAGGVVAAIATFLYAELGAAFPQAGGIYPGLVGVLGRFWAFPYIAMMIVTAPALAGFVVLGFTDYIHAIFPGAPQVPLALGLLLAATTVAVMPVRSGAIITAAFLALELVAVAVLASLALTHPTRSLGVALAHPLTLSHGATIPATATQLGLAFVASVATCGGCFWAMYFGEELKDAPRRIGPVIAWAGQFAALLIGGPLVLVALSLRDLPHTLSADSPMAAFISGTAGATLGTIINAGLLVAFFNALVVGLMAFGRLYYASGRDGFWAQPVNRLLGRLHPRSHSPLTATLIFSAFTAGMMMLGERVLLILSSGGNIFEFLLIAVAVLVGRRRGVIGLHFRAWLHPLIPLLVIAVALIFIAAAWMDPDAGRPSLIFLTCLFVGSLAYYRVRGGGRPGESSSPVPPD